MAAPRPAPQTRVQTLALLDELVLTCRGTDCVEQWSPAPIRADGSDGVVQLSTERCPACGSSCWEVTAVQVASSPCAQTRRRGGRSHPSSRSGRGF
ncbi:hypothetical protein GCM10023200_51980 [Actinomycetospora chlora]|uniref:Uncharacterized protein n=1 Tax=Actinomycetospora chlora TaxID=663608 RepID=A0ABP9CCN7_9PSEU